MESEEFKNAENTGRLFFENKVQCVRKGKINVDGEDRYFSILLYTSDDGEYEKYELAMSVGRIYINTDKIDPESSPDIGGPITIDGKPYKFGGYKKTASNGNEYTRVKLYPKKQDKPSSDDSVPF
tara:strand:- start:580 stop:954 length:375 start_codon:yes stop_codon:yes gene_type:complete